MSNWKNYFQEKTRWFTRFLIIFFWPNDAALATGEKKYIDNDDASGIQHVEALHRINDNPIF